MGNPVGSKIPHPLAMNIVGPARVDQAIEGALDQDIPQTKGIEDAGI
ncbi:hypothetical protein PY650_11205 [Rhizobium calliandrae]|uniref:Uncharacterized protein n=1 Tax=Rhizobium calliandrae TaxID=1312182 RepID=A0ABT7KGA6_9HYPH|nr:hypothetical protein [Rhizobium calliandrae]MDL2406219.1 hypothetical protein [Rhizobium calliandrae]